jgi:hypothetical protein
VLLQIRIRFVGGKSTRPARRMQLRFGVNNKYWGVLGDVSLHGYSANITVATLAAAASANATSIQTIESTDWKPGDEIFITASGHLFDEHDHAVIASVSGSTINLAKPLKYMHYGDTEPFTDEALVNKARFESADMRALVVLITRSIVVENVDSGDAWGPVIVVGQVRHHSAETWRPSVLVLPDSSCDGATVESS